ncbi:unnamed protein product [Brachionus calyciflorus]|uniref:NAD kinase 2, mitochondrial n=1 Tax=Brachionus calyciflorus TaxID=104777 RepID=A0A813M341_9BILA|nr:unnamed protein product [Brachionus calyciflorus]
MNFLYKKPHGQFALLVKNNFLKTQISNLRVCFSILKFYSTSQKSKINFDFSKILVLNKITRYEFEKKRHAKLTEDELKTKLEKRGSNYDRLIEHHNNHYRSLERILNAFKERGIETRVTQRNNYSYADINWANCIFSAGGDGTFLMASAKIKSNEKPVIGVNTDVTSSEGHLLLPKEQSVNFSNTLDKLLNGNFNWLSRARIRIYLEGQSIENQPIELHDQVLNNLEHRYIEHIEENRQIKLNKTQRNANSPVERFRIPTLALNEVFIGESLSARVSYYLMSIDDGPFFRQKSSGIIICTGTGSTSWCYNINKMSVQSMKRIINLVKANVDNGNNRIPENDDKFVQYITNQFNDSIVFEPDQFRMAYTIRDPIINRVFTNETNRGFAKKLVVQSRCFDACLVIDGGQSYQFNDGSKAIMEILPEDALKTVIIHKN